MAKEKTTTKYEGPELLPPKGNEEVGKKVFELLAEIIEDKVNLGLHDRWARNYELYKNRHWRRKPKSNVPLVSANLIYTHIQRTANTLTDNNPTFNVARMGAQSGQDQQINPEYFDDLQHTAEHWWTDQEQQDDLDSSIRNGENYGIAIEKVIFNPKLESGLGEVETVIVDPFHFGFYPVKLTNLKKLQQAEAVLHFYPMSLREAKRTWPDFKDEIKADSEIFKDLGDERRELSGRDQKASGTTAISILSAVKQIFNYFSGSTKDTDDVLIVECWCRDYSQKSEVKKNDKEEDVEESNPNYPGDIRYVVACNEGKVVLEDRGNPNINPELPLEEAQKTYLWDKYPFCAVNSVKDTVCAWGLSDIEQLEQLNIELDKALSQFILVKDRATRLHIVNPKTSGVSNDEFTNVPATIRPSNAQEAAAIRYMDFPQMPVDLQVAINLFKELFFLVAGTFDLDQAQVPGRNVIAFKAIAALLERAATMMRGKIRAYSRLIRERGRMYISHVQNFYTEDRWITFNDKDGKEISKQINGENLRIPAKLTVVTGSTMPISKIQQREEAIELWKLKAIDRAKLLESLDVSDRSEILQRIEIGPVGQAMQKLEAIGVPPELLQLFSQIVQAEPDKLQKAMEQGKVPTFPQVMMEIVQRSGGQIPGNQPSGPEQGEMALKQAEAQKTMAESQKIDAERALVIEKINSERLDQRVKVAGIQLDDEQMAINRAKTVAEVEEMSKKSEIERASFVSNLENRPGYNEKGISSNNQKGE